MKPRERKYHMRKHLRRANKKHPILQAAKARNDELLGRVEKTLLIAASIIRAAHSASSPKYPLGGHHIGGIAIVGENGKEEYIINKN